MAWADLTDWWLSEIESDPAYAEVVTPLLVDVLSPQPESTYLDLGCGEGRVLRTVLASGANAHGLDLNRGLVARARAAFVADALQIPVRDATYDGVYTVLTLEHIEDHARFLGEAARVTRPGGVLALVSNHPVWTAPDSTPISDSFGEVLWRPGDYFSQGTSEVPAGGQTVVFHHRSMSDLLSAAADAGWSLERMLERPHHEYDDQPGIPRLLAARWRLGG